MTRSSERVDGWMEFTARGGDAFRMDASPCSMHGLQVARSYLEARHIHEGG